MGHEMNEREDLEFFCFGQDDGLATGTLHFRGKKVAVFSAQLPELGLFAPRPIGRPTGRDKKSVVAEVTHHAHREMINRMALRDGMNLSVNDINAAILMAMKGASVINDPNGVNGFIETARDLSRQLRRKVEKAKSELGGMAEFMAINKVGIDGIWLAIPCYKTSEGSIEVNCDGWVCRWGGQAEFRKIITKFQIAN